MRFSEYGIVLRSMTAADLEQVRVWRNAPHVRQQMEFRTEILPHAQQEWFSQMDLTCNLYLLVEVAGQVIGVVHLKEVNWEEGVGEAGIFIGKKEFLGGMEPVLAVLALMDLAFLCLGLRALRAKVKADAVQTLDFNARLGYVPLAAGNGQEFLQLRVDKAGYLGRTAALRKIASRLRVESPTLTWAKEEVFWEAKVQASKT